MKKKLLFIVPLPPPITGQSLASAVLLSNLENDFDVFTVNYSRENAIKKAGFDFNFIKKIIKLGNVIKKQAKIANIIYFTISQSLLGNLKDLFFLFKIGKYGRKKTIIHLHGGFFDKYIKKTNFIVKFLNKLLFKDIKFGIVLGKSLISCLTCILPQEKIKIVPNFYSDEILISQSRLISKWNNPKKINLLFLSNLMEEKGYNELIDGFLELNENERNKFDLFIAGDFEDSEKKHNFYRKINDFDNIYYLGVVKGEDKINLLQKSHCFFLPTYYHIEGQPISILEAYSAGLVVFTTNHNGIPDIFTDNINGFFVEKKSKESITASLLNLLQNFEKYKDIAFFNKEFSSNFTKDQFILNIKDILNSDSILN
ncbi:MAG: hypothetical protein A2086_00785 [Spirochaetes bacterium GWD1_27_9]|nr:MAG: hypothetical protein A2Y34_02785 [Spirochaetes bacterium GWC1_27_15]OHD32545.1 MAG: hypothetical protein A2086_00785 [Spirochaetes bacterium GWD1_27_9]